MNRHYYSHHIFLFFTLLVLLMQTDLPAQPCQGIIWTEDFGSGSDPVGMANSNVNNAYIFQNFGVQPGNYGIVNFFNYHSSWHIVPEDHTPGDINGYFLVIDGLNSQPEFYSVQIDNLLTGTDYEFSGWAMNIDLPLFQSDLTFSFSICDLSGNELASTTTGIIPATDTPLWTNHGLTFNTGSNTSVLLKVVFTATGYDDFAFDDFVLTQLETAAIYNLNQTLCSGESININGTIFDETNPDGVITFPGASWQGCDSVVNVQLNFLPPTFNTINQTLCEGESIVVDGTIFDIGNPSGTVFIPNGNSFGCDSTVSVDLTFQPSVLVSLSGGGHICAGDSITLIFNTDDNTLLADITVENGIDPPVQINGVGNGSTFWVSPSVTGTYSITDMSYPGGICFLETGQGTTVSVSNLNPVITTSDYNGVGISCAGETDGTITLLIPDGQPPFLYQWSSGDNAAQLSGLGAGTYSVTITDSAGCNTSAIAILNEPPALQPVANITPPLCYGEPTGSIVLTAPGYNVPLQFFSWYEGLFSPVDSFPIAITSLQSDTYPISIIDANGCEAALEVLLPAPAEHTLNLGTDITLNFGDSIFLTAQTNFDPDSITWNPVDYLNFQDEAHAFAFPFETTIYTVSAADSNGCIVSDQLVIYIDQTRQIFVPNIFSPNGDGNNDIISVFANPGQVSLFRTFRIYARWGTLLYEANDFLPTDTGIGWDGQYRGSPFQPGVITWYLEVVYIDGSSEILKGDITLVR